jgi:hypothetical protein
MAALFPAIYDMIDKNPYKDQCIALRRDEQTTTAQSSEEWDAFAVKPIQPPGPLSVLLWHLDPMFSMGTPALRKQILTEKLLELHQRVDTELIGRRWPRKKIQDVLATQVSAGAPNTSDLVEEVLCELFQIQKVRLSKKSKTIQFFPADLRNWTSDRRILVADDDHCWHYEPKEQISFVSWLTTKEDQGWGIHWPTADGKIEELKQAVNQKGLSARPALNSDSKKIKKEDYARVLGKAETISILSNLGLRIQ